MNEEHEEQEPHFSFHLGGQREITPADVALGNLMMASHTLSIATLHANVQIAERMVGMAARGVRSDSSPFDTASGNVALHDLQEAALAYAESLGYVKPA